MLHFVVATIFIGFVMMAAIQTIFFNGDCAPDVISLVYNTKGINNKVTASTVPLQTHIS